MKKFITPVFLVTTLFTFLVVLHAKAANDYQVVRVGCSLLDKYNGNVFRLVFVLTINESIKFIRLNHAAGNEEPITNVVFTPETLNFYWREQRVHVNRLNGHLSIEHKPGHYLNGRCEKISQKKKF